MATAKKSKASLPHIEIIIETQALLQHGRSEIVPYFVETVNVLMGRGEAKKDAGNEDIFSPEIVKYFKNNSEATYRIIDRKDLLNEVSSGEIYPFDFVVASSPQVLKKAKVNELEIISLALPKKNAPPICFHDVPKIIFERMGKTQPA